VTGIGNTYVGAGTHCSAIGGGTIMVEVNGDINACSP